MPWKATQREPEKVDLGTAKMKASIVRFNRVLSELDEILAPPPKKRKRCEKSRNGNGRKD